MDDRTEILKARYSNVRDIDEKLDLNADLVNFYWQEAAYWGFETVKAARKVWIFRQKKGLETGKSGFELQKHIETMYEYKQFFERLTNTFTNLAMAGAQMEARNGHGYTLAGQPRRS